MSCTKITCTNCVFCVRFIFLPLLFSLFLFFYFFCSCSGVNIWNPLNLKLTLEKKKKTVLNGLLWRSRSSSPLHLAAFPSLLTAMNQGNQLRSFTECWEGRCVECEEEVDVRVQLLDFRGQNSLVFLPAVIIFNQACFAFAYHAT